MALHVILMGPPQAGKGTQAQLLVARFGFVHLATGDLLRDISTQDSPFGRKVSTLLQRGEYVPDDLVTQLVVERMDQHSVLLDGFPRTIAQAETLDHLGITMHGVFVLDVPEPVLIGRAQDRIFCPHCNAVYGIRSKPPRTPWTCDVCGHGLAQRTDDAPSTVHRRLEVYRQRSEPVVRYYEARHLVRHIDGHGSVDDVTAELQTAVAALLDSAHPVDAH